MWLFFAPQQKNRLGQIMHADAVYGLFWGQDFEDYTIS